MRAILCHNPKAGNEGHGKADLLAALALAGIDGVYCSTKACDLAAALAEPADLVIAAGGDGTVAKVVKAMPDRTVPLAILPLGTANNVARSFAIAGSPHELAEGWRRDRWRPLDIARARGPWGEALFIEAVGLGPLAQTVQSVPDSHAGAGRLVAGRRALRDLLAEAPPIDAMITIDGMPLADLDGLITMEIANTTYTGPGLRLPAPVDPGDGMLNVIVVRERDRAAFRDWLEAPHGGPMPVIAHAARQVDFTWTGAVLHIDDETPELAMGAHAASARMDGAVRILTPPRRRGPS